MALQNIGAGNQDDAFYRYKMPKLVTKVEGRGNGIKTNLVNMVDVAKALARSPSYTTKYFGCELGAQSKFDEKTGTSIVNGAHDTAKLANLLENFIKKYVQCYGCGNPETDIVITRNHMITLKCAACGYVSDVDMRDKITGFILKNPPEVQKKGRKDGVPKLNGFRRSEKERLREGDAVDEQKKKLKRDLSKKKLKSCDEQWVKRSLRKNGVIAGDKDGVRGVGDKGCGGGGDGDDDEGIQWHTDTSIAAAKQRIKEQLSSVTSEMVMLNDFCNDEGLKESSQKKDINAEKSPQKLHSNGDWMKISEEVKEAVDHQQECRQGNNITQMQNGNGVSKILGEDCNDGLVDKLVKDFRNCLNMGFSTDRLAMHLHSMEGLPQRKVMEAYFLALFNGFSKGLSKEVGKRKGYLVKVIDNKASQILLLNVLESYCCTTQGIGKEIALVLKVLYDGDILEEEQILQWYDQIGGERDHKNASKVRKDALPFIQWLKEAEVEEE